MKLLVIGNITIDELFAVDRTPRLGTTSIVKTHKRLFGGRGANVAVVATKLGVPSDLISVVGDDLPKTYRAHLKAVGVQIGMIQTVHGRSTPRFFEFHDHGAHSVSFLSPLIGREKLNVDSRADDYDGVFFTPFDANLRREDFTTPLFTHPDVFLSLGEEMHGIDATVVSAALGFASHLIVTEEELHALLTKTQLEAGPDLLVRYPKLKAVVATLGPAGVRGMARGESLEVPAAASRPVAAFGAGDAFTAGYILATLLRVSLLQRLRFGATVAAAAIESESVQDFDPDWEELDRRFLSAFGERMPSRTKKPDY